MARRDLSLPPTSTTLIESDGGHRWRMEFADGVTEFAPDLLIVPFPSRANAEQWAIRNLGRRNWPY